MTRAFRSATNASPPFEDFLSMIPIPGKEGQKNESSFGEKIDGKDVDLFIVTLYNETRNGIPTEGEMNT